MHNDEFRVLFAWCVGQPEEWMAAGVVVHQNGHATTHMYRMAAAAPSPNGRTGDG